MVDKRVELPQSALLSRELRTHLGDKLREYYASAQQLPVADSLAENIERWMRGNNSNKTTE